MATLQQLEQALAGAHKAGDTDAARRLAAIIIEARKNPQNLLPDATIQETVPRQPEPSALEQVVGAGETAATIFTGATSGTAGMIGGTLKGIAEQMLAGNFGTQVGADAVERSAAEGMQALTYAPRTRAGQRQVEVVGMALEPLVAVAPMTAEIGAIGAGARQAAQGVAPIVGARAARVTQPVVAAGQRAIQAVRERVTPAQEAGGFGGRSAGAAELTMEQQRLAQAAELPVDPQLTKGQRTGDFALRRFEEETAKDAELGEPLRQRGAQQNVAVAQNLDEFLEATGAEQGTRLGAGLVITDALRRSYASGKNKVRALYQQARKDGEMLTPVATDDVVATINASRSAESTAPVITAAKRELIRLGGALEEADGSLSPRQLSLADMEQVRQLVTRATKQEGPDLKFGGDIKRAIDASTEGKGGAAYKAARAAYAKLAQQFENDSLVSQLINTKKGKVDRQVALENVVDRIRSAPKESVERMRNLLWAQGDNGRQAWRETQGAMIRDIAEKTFENVSRDVQGNPIPSAAKLNKVLTELDKAGKLDLIFTKAGAEQLRTLNEVVKVIKVLPPGAVNSSGTASVLAGIIDAMAIASSGIPVPLVTLTRQAAKLARQAKIKSKIRESLEAPRNNSGAL